MATNVMEHTQQNTNGFLVKWGLVTALLGAITTILAAHGMIFFVLTAAVGLVTGVGQWWLLRDHIRGAWQWILASTLGWIGGYVIAAGILAGIIGPMFAGSLNGVIVQILTVVLYGLMFAGLGASQAMLLRRRGYNGMKWVAFSALGGVLLGVALQLTCSLGGGTFLFGGMLTEAETVSTTMCVEIGAILPRLQTSEPLFNVVPLSYAAHLFGWIAYAAATAFGWKLLLKRA